MSLSGVVVDGSRTAGCQMARLVGGAGTGKTTALLGLMDGLIDRGVHPLDIGFASFTRAAVGTARDRAADRFGLEPRVIDEDGWFRTIHSVCFRATGCDRSRVLTDADGKWLKESVGEDIDVTSFDDLTELSFTSKSDAGKALGVWSNARNCLVSLRTAYDLARSLSEDGELPSYEMTLDFVRRYEQAKRLDNKVDFVDMLADFAGIGFEPGMEPFDRAPIGEVPQVAAWLFDEQQDVSPLLSAVCRRLVEGATYGYLVGDPFQSIYGFAGSDPALFMNWEVSKQKVMPKSYRCGKEIMALGELVLSRCSDYFDRQIAPADHAGSIERTDRDSGVRRIDPRESWFAIARTNFSARNIGVQLTERGIPWKNTRGHGSPWIAPKRNQVCLALEAVEAGGVCRGEHWKAAVSMLPATLGKGAGAVPLLRRGFKSRIAEMSIDEVNATFPVVMAGGDGDLPGATPRLRSMLLSGEWRKFIPFSETFLRAVRTWGTDAVLDPKVSVGTIHSVKGHEADNVLYHTALNGRIVRAMSESALFRNEEARIAYVAITRARHRLLIADDESRYRMEV